ncbi:MAG: ferredoxin-type protein NapG [Magnetococcales bacterium]|nr:ferredoxin-type protein NapG [Magnetococcales bacterium]
MAESRKSELKASPPDGRRQLTRRQAIKETVQTACTVSLVGMLVAWKAEGAKKDLPAEALRPPGALPEADFQAKCLRCGLCVRDCPFDTLKLSRVGDGVSLGTPYFHAREIPCEMCEDIPCVKACPSGALDPELTDIDKARMGLAVLLDQETCIAFLGLRCEVCYRVCPAIDQAISLEYRHNVRSGVHAQFIPVVHSDACTGCGKCERACILEEAAIKVLPIKLAKGQLGAHYRKGWEEKRKAGKSLVAPDVPHRYNLPDGVSYQHGTIGLVQPEDTPAELKARFGPSAMDILNQGSEVGE